MLLHRMIGFPRHLFKCFDGSTFFFTKSIRRVIHKDGKEQTAIYVEMEPREHADGVVHGGYISRRRLRIHG